MRWESSTRVLILLAPIIRWIRKMLHNYYDCPIAVFKSKVDICNWVMQCTISLLSLSFTFRFKCFFSLADDFRRQLKKAAWWDNSRADNFGWRWKEKYQFYTWLLCLAPPIFAIVFVGRELNNSMAAKWTVVTKIKIQIVQFCGCTLPFSAESLSIGSFCWWSWADMFVHVLIRCHPALLNCKGWHRVYRFNRLYFIRIRVQARKQQRKIEQSYSELNSNE